MIVMFRARSILQLTIVGFFAVATLLIAALLVTAQQLDSLSDRSQVTVGAAAMAMSASRQLIEQTREMERNALQYVILGDASIYQLYVNRRQDFTTAARLLISLDLGGEAAQFAAILVQDEAEAFVRLSNSPERRRVESDYLNFSRMAYQIADSIETWIDDQQTSLREQSENTQRALTVQAILFIGAASVLAVLFTILITRPLRQIDKAINQLGGGHYNEAIKITGPRDLQSLGVRLDWLRGRLGELEQQRASFLRHVSHELKTPLASMQEGAALLNEGVVGSLTPEQHEISRIIGSNCQRLQGLIEDLLRHNSQNFEVLNAMPEQIRFDQLIEKVVQAHQLPITSGRNTVRRHLERVWVLADQERLRVVIDNLFTNALKYSPEGGVITLRLFMDQNDAVFEISDQGPGVPQEEWQRIFEAFYRGSVEPRKPYSGTGLGLAIAREYVLAGGGTIELCNQTPGDQDSGACFRVTMPVSGPGEAANPSH